MQAVKLHLQLTYRTEKLFMEQLGQADISVKPFPLVFPTSPNEYL